MLTDQDIYHFKEGTHGRLYEKLGCQLTREGNTDGARFTLWAPNAVSCVGVRGFQRLGRGCSSVVPAQR